jgi:hypothetical protein
LLYLPHRLLPKKQETEGLLSRISLILIKILNQ